MRKVAVVAVILGLAAWAIPADAAVIINEFLGSTTSTDDEFIELLNTGGAPVDVSNWQIELYDSDVGASYGGLDGGSPHVIPAATVIAPGGYLLMANPEFSNNYTATVDVALPANAIENSSFTMILKDAALTTIQTLFVWDSGAGDSANDAGVAVVPDSTIGPDGTFLPAGGYRVGDASPNWALLEFSPKPAPSATPGGPNIPEPGSLALFVIGGLLAARRRR